MKKICMFLGMVTMILNSCQKNETIKEKQLNISFNMDPHTIDARKSGDLVSSSMIFMLFNGLTEINSNGSIGLALAKSYKLSEDKKTYVFYIKENAKWSDGHKITAYDFEKSWKKIIDPSFPSLCPQLFYPIKNAEKAAKGEVSLDDVGINALDDHTLVVHLNNPTPYFLSLTSYCIYFPVPSHIDEKDPHWENNIGEKFVCNGPFTLTKWDHNDKIIVEKNPLYWNSKNISLDKISIHIVQDENTALQMYENGQLDWIGAQLSPLPLDSIPHLLKKKDYQLNPIGGTTFCAFNTEKFPFNNLNIRKALGLAINRKALIDNINQSNDLIATRCIPPILMNNKNLNLIKDNDIKKAKIFFEQGLNELKIKKEDLNITFSYGSNILHKKYAEALVENWEKIFEISIKLQQFEEKVMMDRMHKHQFQVGLNYWVIQYNDSMNIFDRFKSKKCSKNYPNWENKNYINYLDYSMTLTNSDEREQILEKAEELFMEEMPLSPIYHHNYITLTKPHIKNIFIGPVAELHFDKAYFPKK